MEQFRQVGETVGSLKALMLLKHEIQINQRQCCLLYDILTLAFEIVSEEIKQNLRLDDPTTKWKALELPLKELHRAFKEAELYIRHSTDMKDWWGKAVSLPTNRDCVELHVHNLLCCFPVVIEAVETAAELSGANQDEMQRRRAVLMQKYDRECDDPGMFMWRFGRQYLVPREICACIDTAWRDDRRLLLQKIRERMTAGSKNEQKLGELLVKKLSCEEESGEKVMLLPSSVLVDYNVRRRLGSGYPSGGGHLKEIRWLGESFALRTFYGDIDPLQSEISILLSLSHPNVLDYFCALYDEDRKEGFLVMELMNKDLALYMKENSSHRNRIPFTVPTAVDIMLQVGRGMEYLHSRKIYHGDLNPSNILLKLRNASVGGFQAKVAGFSISSIKSCSSVRNAKPAGADLEIWLAPEVLTELEQPGHANCATRYTAKADVYSFGMLCFELLSGKVPFEDDHLRGEKMARNIRAGERPLFSTPAPKYLTNLIRRCWQTEPNLRPTFSSICRILRYIKKVLIINPDHGDPYSPPPLVDYCDMESRYLKKFPGEASTGLGLVSQIPFQMFSYKVVEKEKLYNRKWDSAGDHSLFDDEHLATMDDLFLEPSRRKSVCSEIIDSHYSTIAADLRSVKSEIPHRRFFPFDHASVGSESPGRRISTPIIPERKAMFVEEQRSPRVQALGRIPEQNATGGQKQVKVLDSATTAPKVVECQSASPRIWDNSKLASSKLTKVKSENLLTMERKPSLGHVADRKPASVESPQGKIHALASGCRDTAEVPETKARQNAESTQNTGNLESAGRKPVEHTKMKNQKHGNSKNSEKKPVEDTENKNQKASNSENSEKEPAEDTENKNLKSRNSVNSEKKHAEEAKVRNQNQANSKNSDKKSVKDITAKVMPAKNDSSQPSPAKTKTTKPIFSAASSPLRPYQTGSEAPKSDLTSTVARIKKTNLTSSPASSPSRSFKLHGSSQAPIDESPLSSPARVKKTVLTFSPAASPLRIFKARACEALDNDSPMSSPPIMRKNIPGISPASSPLRTFKTRAFSETPLNNESPVPSPARVKKTISNFSPSRAFKTCASPKHSLDCHSRELSSPISASSPCTRCSRLGKKVYCQQ